MIWVAQGEFYPTKFSVQSDHMKNRDFSVLKVDDSEYMFPNISEID